MYLRKLWLIIAVLGAMASPLSFGLGLGEITLNSNLNQPLDAEIKLLQVRDLTREEIFAQLGSGEDFRRRGVERIFFLQDIRFEVQLDNPSGPIVKLTSQKPVVEPFLIFIVQLEWPSGRAQREYTLLMDLPVFTDRPVEPVQGVQTQPRVQSPPPAPPVQQAQPRPQPAPVTQPAPAPQRTTPPPPLPTRQDPPPPVQPQASTPAPAPAPQPLNPSLQSGDTYTVRENDTLWEIALSTRPNRGVSVQQTMLALQRLNPEAFINGNINLLKEGQVLRIPDQSEIQQLDQRAAVTEVAYQNTQWSGNPDGLVSGAELQGSRVTDSSSTASDDRRGQLTLASPSDPSRASGDRSGSGLSASERDALENDLAISLEQLDSSQRENSELSERVEELEEQITTMERLIEVSNEEMRTLQLALEQNAENADVSIELPDNLTDSAETVSDDAMTDDVVIEETADADSSNNLDSATETPAASVQPPPVAPPVVPARRDPSIVEMLMGYIWYIGAAIVALLLAGFYFWHRKTQAEMESFDDFDEEYEGDGEMDFAQDDYDEEPLEETDLDLDDDQEIEEEEAEPVAPTEAQTGDAVGEADIYIAYGKYDQAEEMLKKAIVNEPNNVDARVKLLEVYSETSDATKFDQEYGKLLALGDATANEKAADLRSAIAGIAAYQAVDTTLDRQFEETVDTTPADDVEETDSLDLNFDLAEDDLEDSNEPENDGIDFDLGDIEEPELDLSEDLTASNPALADDQIDVTKDEDDFDLTDFSLDLDDEEDDTKSALDSDDEELTLDLDDDDQGSEELSLSDTDEDGELSLDLEEDDDLSFDLDMDEEEFDKEFDSVMAEEPEEIKPAQDPSVNETLSRDFDAGIDFDAGDDDKDEEAIAKDDDILSDLEFSAASLASEEATKEALNESASKHTSADTVSNDDDDFDLDMGDVDLAALDEEMDALVGDIDDIDDDDVAVSPTEVVQAVTDSGVDDIEVDLDIDEPETSANESLVSSDDAEMDEDAELDFLADTDEVATKLDLARAYIDMGDKDGAKDILSEVVSEGDDDQKKEAQELLGKIT